MPFTFTDTCCRFHAVMYSRPIYMLIIMWALMCEWSANITSSYYSIIKYGYPCNIFEIRVNCPNNRPGLFWFVYLSMRLCLCRFSSKRQHNSKVCHWLRSFEMKAVFIYLDLRNEYQIVHSCKSVMLRKQFNMQHVLSYE